MAKRSKQTNGIDAEVAADFIKRVENLKADLLSEQGSYMSACKGIREDIKEVYSEAKSSAGIPTRTLKALVRKRELEAKVEALTAGLDIDERSSFEQLVEDLGNLVDLPLGQAAIDAQKRKDAKEFDLAGGGGKKAKGKATSPEEAAALAEVESKGVVGAIGDQAASFTETAATH